MPSQIIKTISSLPTKKRRPDNRISKRKALRTIIDDRRTRDIKKTSYKIELERIQQEVQLPRKSHAASRIGALRQKLKSLQHQNNAEQEFDNGSLNGVTVSAQITFKIVMSKQ